MMILTHAMQKKAPRPSGDPAIVATYGSVTWRRSSRPSGMHAIRPIGTAYTATSALPHVGCTRVAGLPKRPAVVGRVYPRAPHFANREWWPSCNSAF